MLVSCLPLTSVLPPASTKQARFSASKPRTTERHPSHQTSMVHLPWTPPTIPLPKLGQQIPSHLVPPRCRTRLPQDATHSRADSRTVSSCTSPATMANTHNSNGTSRPIITTSSTEAARHLHQRRRVHRQRPAQHRSYLRCRGH